MHIFSKYYTFLFLALSIALGSNVVAVPPEEQLPKPGVPIKVVTELDVEKWLYEKSIVPFQGRKTEVRKKFDQALDELSKTGNPASLKFLCYIHFNELRGLMARDQHNGPIARILESGKFSVNLPELIEKRFEFRFSDFQPDESWWSLFSHNPTPISQYWRQQQGETPCTLASITHGGSAYFLLDFLMGKKLGYKLEKHGYGIQVAPATDSYKNGAQSRAKEYAERIDGTTFDYPIVLEAKIEIGHLLPAHNECEAGLTQERAKYMQGVEFTVWGSTGIPQKAITELTNFGSVVDMTLKQDYPKK